MLAKHAALGAERPDGVLSQGPSTLTRINPERHDSWPGKPHDVAAEPGQRADTVLPERAPPESFRGHPVCSTTTARSSNEESCPPRCATGPRHQLEDQVPVSQRNTSGSGTASPSPPIGRTPRKRGADNGGRGTGSAPTVDLVGGRPPMMALRAAPLLARASSSTGLPDRVGTGRGGHIDELRPATWPTWTDRCRCRSAGTSLKLLRRFLRRMRQVGTSACAGSHRWADATGRRSHRAPTISLRVSSSQAGNGGTSVGHRAEGRGGRGVWSAACFHHHERLCYAAASGRAGPTSPTRSASAGRLDARGERGDLSGGPARSRPCQLRGGLGWLLPRCGGDGQGHRRSAPAPPPVPTRGPCSCSTNRRGSTPSVTVVDDGRCPSRATTTASTGSSASTTARRAVAAPSNP